MAAAIKVAEGDKYVLGLLQILENTAGARG
jgi:hypothetical protein